MTFAESCTLRQGKWPGIFTGLLSLVGIGTSHGLGSLSKPAALCPGLSLPAPLLGGSERVWAQGQAGVRMVASSAGSLPFNMKSRARNCIKTCVIIPEEGSTQPLVIAGLL